MIYRSRTDYPGHLYDWISHTIHVWYIHLHLVDVYGRCRQIYQSHGSYGYVQRLPQRHTFAGPRFRVLQCNLWGRSIAQVYCKMLEIAMPVTCHEKHVKVETEVCFTVMILLFNAFFWMNLWSVELSNSFHGNIRMRNIYIHNTLIDEIRLCFWHDTKCLSVSYVEPSPIIASMVSRISVYMFGWFFEWFLWTIHDPMDVSENRGTPKSSILKGISIINHPFWGYPYFRKHPYIHYDSNLDMFWNAVVMATLSTLQSLREYSVFTWV